jgi:hypothetical protein
MLNQKYFFHQGDKKCIVYITVVVVLFSLLELGLSLVLSVVVPILGLFVLLMHKNLLTRFTNPFDYGIVVLQ